MKFFTSKNPHYEHLRKKWVGRYQEASDNVVNKHLRHLALGGMGGLLLLNTPSNMLLPSPVLSQEVGTQAMLDSNSSKNAVLASELAGFLPKETRALEISEEKKVEELIYKNLNIKVASELENKRLNRIYGVIGGEQHLYRFPGDNLHAHARDAKDWAMYGSSGIAPGLGAWGYFASSKEAFTKEDEERERYYLAVQTFLSSGFAERFKEYRDFFRFRKMLVVNPKTGQAVVAVIGDAGPAVWTKKHLGGSPEVMHELGLATGPRKGEVLYLFVDDPENKIPLGPVKVAE